MVIRTVCDKVTLAPSLLPGIKIKTRGWVEGLPVCFCFDFFCIKCKRILLNKEPGYSSVGVGAGLGILRIINSISVISGG